MKVKVGKRTYCVEFIGYAKSPRYGSDKEKRVLVTTKCMITRDSNRVIGTGSATQNYRDELDLHKGRKFSFARALAKTGLKKETRAAFWNKYKEDYPIPSK